MAGFGGVDEERRRAGGGERGRHLARDMAGFADARDDHAAGAAQHHLDRARKVGGNLGLETEHGLRFDVEGLLGQGQRSIRIEIRYHGGEV